MINIIDLRENIIDHFEPEEEEEEEEEEEMLEDKNKIDINIDRHC